MTTIHELKEAILEMEKVAHEWEQQADEAWAQADADFYEEIAGQYRIAAACCWEKLERLEAGDGWFRPEKGELPPDAGTVIAIVSGSPADGVTLTGSYQTASYFANNPADWVIDEWTEWENPTVHCWQPTPEAPEEVKKKIQEIWDKIAAGEQV